MEPLNVRGYERLAADRLDPGARGYYAGGAGDEVTLRDNVAAFGRLKLRPRMLVDVNACSTATTVLGWYGGVRIGGGSHYKPRTSSLEPAGHPW